MSAKILNSFKLLRLQRKIDFCFQFFSFFELHNSATEEEKGKKMEGKIILQPIEKNGMSSIIFSK